MEIVYCEPLTIDEEADFLQMVNDAAEAGDITEEEAMEMIEREYVLLALVK
jgi:hypothetical protein